MFAFKAAIVVLVLFAAGVLRDRRSFANAVLLGLALALLALGTAERLARADDAVSRLVLLAVFALVAIAPLLVAGYLVVNGVTMVRRESLRPSNLLSLLVGLGILAVIGFRLATPLTSSGELALSATIVMLLFGYVSFQCVSFVLYAFLYGRLRVPRHADFVVVLGSGLLDGGRIPPLLASRLDRGHAVFRALAARGSDPVLIVSGGKGNDEQVSEADAMAGYLAARGFPTERIEREDQSANTEENLANSKAIMDRLRPGATCVIVTSNYHVFRTAMIARRIGVRGQVTGARTAGYYWPSATLREFAAVFLSYKAVNLALCFLLVAIPVTVTLLHHAPAGPTAVHATVAVAVGHEHRHLPAAQPPQQRMVRASICWPACRLAGEEHAEPVSAFITRTTFTRLGADAWVHPVSGAPGERALSSSSQPPSR